MTSDETKMKIETTKEEEKVPKTKPKTTGRGGQSAGRKSRAYLYSKNQRKKKLNEK
jgi:hypothetical protein